LDEPPELLDDGGVYEEPPELLDPLEDGGSTTATTVVFGLDFLGLGLGFAFGLRLRSGRLLSAFLSALSSALSAGVGVGVGSA
jgi:hypothetical protein